VKSSHAMRLFILHLKAPIPVLVEMNIKKCQQRIESITCISSNTSIKLEYWYVSHSKKHQYRIVIVIAH